MPEHSIAVDVQLRMFSFYCLCSYHAYILLQVRVDFVGAVDDACNVIAAHVLQSVWR